MVVPFNSGPFATAELASASVMGAMTEMGRNQKVTLSSINVTEIDGSFYAEAVFDVEDLEIEDEVDENADGKSEKEQSEEIIAKENDLYALMHGTNAWGSAPNSIPEPEEPVEPAHYGDGSTAGENAPASIYADDYTERRDAIESENAMVSEAEREDALVMSEQLANDFAVAEEGASDSSGSADLAGLAFMPPTVSDIDDPENDSEDDDDETEDEKDRRRRDLEETLKLQPEIPDIEAPETPAPGA